MLYAGTERSRAAFRGKQGIVPTRWIVAQKRWSERSIEGVDTKKYRLNKREGRERDRVNRYISVRRDTQRVEWSELSSLFIAGDRKCA